MGMNCQEDYLFDGLGELSVPHLTVWEADIEETRAETPTPEYYTIQFISDVNDLSPDVCDHARNVLDIDVQNERLLSMALETKSFGSTKVGCDPVRRIVAMRALFDARSLPLMTSMSTSTVQPGEKTFPSNYDIDSEKWAKLAEGGTYRPASQISTRPDLHLRDVAFKQGAFAELFKDAARRMLASFCIEDKDRKLSDYNIKFFGGEQGIHPDGSITRLEVSWCQSNADPDDTICTLRIPLLVVQNIMTELLIEAHSNEDIIPPFTTIDEMTAHMHRSAKLPKKIVCAISAVEEIVRAWVESPILGVHESDDPISFFDKMSAV